MKTSIKILGVLLAAATLASCQDKFDSPDVNAPVADIKANMTILDLKTKYWNDATNYIDTIGVHNGVVDNGTYVISGRVVSSDEAGNVFKSLVIQDETAALAISINSYNLYLKYRIGQEIVIDVKGMYIGKYNGLVQLGMPEWYEQGNAWEATFMAPEFFIAHAQPNGWPEPAKIDTLEINSFSELPSNPEGLCKYQSQLVKFNNVYFQNGGVEQFAEYHSSGVNQNIVDVNGSVLPVRTSGYSNFWNKYLPKEHGDVVCILSYYGTTGWQLILNDYEGCMNFGHPTITPGTEDNPYGVKEAVSLIEAGKGKSAWVEGYIVGAVAPEVTEVKSNSDIEWGADVVLPNTLVIGATLDTKDIKDALVIALPQGSVFRQYGNLVDHPDNYKRHISVKGTFGKYMGTYGVLDNRGTADEFHIEGVIIDDGKIPDGTGTADAPYNVEQVIAKNPQGGADNPDEKDVWVAGYIVGWADMSSVYYINAETARFSVPATLATNILLAPTADVTDYTKCIGIQLPSGDVRKALNLMDNPGNLGRGVKIFGNIAKYSGVPGLRTASQYAWLGDDPTPPGPTVDALYKEAFSNTQGDFIINNVNLPSGLQYVWSATEKYGMKASAFANSTSYASESWLISPVFNLANATDVTLDFEQANNKYGSASDIPVQSSLWVSVNGGNWSQLTVPTYGTNADWNFVNSGDIDLSAYAGKKISIGFKYTSTAAAAGTWEVKNFELKGKGSVTTSPAIIPGGGDPEPPIGDNSADFNTLNGGVPNTMQYGTYSTTNGWVADWSLVLAGGTDATAFVSADSKFLFPCLDGTSARTGKLTSPTLKGGVKKLTFNYGFPYNETKVAVVVNILQGGTVVATTTLTADPATKAQVFSFSHDFNVTGDCVIEIVNSCITASTKSNADRIAIWNLTWTN